MNIDLSQPSVSRSNRLLVTYQCFLVVVSIAIFFTKLDVFAEQKGWLQFTPLQWTTLLIIASIPLVLALKNRFDYFPKPILIWSVGYLAISCLGFLIALPFVPGIPIETTIQDLETRFLAVFSLVLMSVVFTTDNFKVFTWARRAIFLATLIAIFNNYIEFVNPETLALPTSVEGRSAGFYVNSNESAMGLILGMIFSTVLVDKKYRLLFLLAVLFGITLTFSRGGFLGWLIVILVFSFKDLIHSNHILSLFIGILLIFSTLLSQVDNLAYLTKPDGSPIFNDDTLSRIEWIKNPVGTEDPDSNSRLGLALDAWRKFEAHPFIGNGISASREIDSPLKPDSIERYGERPHNIYLVNLVEHGFMGFFIFPSLILAVIWRAKGSIRSIAWTFGVYYVVVGLFGHTLLYDNYSLLSLAFMGCMSQYSYLSYQKG
jgi:hypothetical protein